MQHLKELQHKIDQTEFEKFIESYFTSRGSDVYFFRYCK